jgi:hypothetical protein
MPDDPEYRDTWTQYRRRNRLVVVLLLGFYPLLYLIVQPLYELFKNDWIGHGFGLVWFVSVLALLIRNEYLRCPRCGKYFFTKRFSLLTFQVNRCINCNLPKWSLGDDNQSLKTESEEHRREAGQW